MTKHLTIDFETRSKFDLKKGGAAAYAQDPSTEVICLSLKCAGANPAIWFSPNFREGVESISDGSVRKTIEDADVIEAHNAQFEYFIWKYVMPKYGFAMFDTRKLRCSAAKAAMYGLPRDLAGACVAAGVSQQKDLEGSRLMMQLCKPRAALVAEQRADPDWASKTYWRGNPEMFRRLGEYCKQDARAEEALSMALPELPELEQALWQLDLLINDRGIGIDVQSASNILRQVEEHTAELNKEFKRRTGLESPRQRNATLQYLISLGVGIGSLTADDVEKALATTEDEVAKRILELRQSVSKSSTAKYKSMLKTVGAEDRVRGALMYHGAGTGRWSGRLIQPQNFPRGTFGDTDACIELFNHGNVENVKMLYGDPMVAASTCLRGMIVPKPGYEFVCADYSAIEGRVLAWLADEQEALDVYRSGRDPYKVAAFAIYHMEYEDVTKTQRQVGKVAELALGYQGAVSAFNSMAVNYGVSLPESEVKEIVKKWRANRPKTVALWAGLEDAAHMAVQNPGKIYSYEKSHFIVHRGYLVIKLPSGRCLWYKNPRYASKAMPWGGTKEVVAYDGVDGYTRKWMVQYLYGGLLAENVTQAVARDILVNGLFNVEKAGYPVVMHVHDEAVSEVPRGFGSVEEYEKLMCELPAWAEGLPIKAEGWRGLRYKK